MAVVAVAEVAVAEAEAAEAAAAAFPSSIPAAFLHIDGI